MEGTRQRAVAEVDDRAPQYPSGLIDTKPHSAIAIKEAQPVLALIHADALFANARYRVRLHQYRNLGRLKVEQLSEQHGINHDIAIGDFDLHGESSAGEFDPSVELDKKAASFDELNMMRHF